MTFISWILLAACIASLLAIVAVILLERCNVDECYPPLDDVEEYDVRFKPKTGAND